jgi:hypothetical protein
MSLSCFTKLARIKILRNKIPKPSMEILYKKMVQRSNVGTMDLEHFFSALEQLAEMVFGREMGSSLDPLIDLIEQNYHELLPDMSRFIKK